MHQRALKVLEFEKVKDQLLEHISSSLGRELAERLFPSTDFDEVVRLQEETDEAAKVLRIKGNVPLGGIFDIRPHVKRSVIGGVLSPHELVQIASTIHASRQIKRFIEEFAEDEGGITHLLGQTEKIIVLATLEQAIKNAIDDNGEVVDSASETLRSLRNQLRSKEAKVRERLESMTRSSNAQKMLSDAIVTIRNDRFVIPVKQEYRAHYGGIIHDQSSSGQTLFIEPQVIVQLNNELQSIRIKEQQEIERILMMLSGQSAEYSSELETIAKVMANLDFMFAKARYSRQLKASKPIMNQDGRISLVKARHPLIPIDEVVANDIIDRQGVQYNCHNRPKYRWKNSHSKNSRTMHINGTVRIANSCFGWIGNGRLWCYLR